MIGQRLGDDAREDRLEQLPARDVDGHRQAVRLAERAPLGQLAAGLAQHESPERRDQPGLLGDGDELVGRHHVPVGVAPAGQRLEAVQAAVGRVRDRLVGDAEADAVDRRLVEPAPQARLDVQARQCSLVQRRVEHRVPAAALVLGAVHRGVGVADDRLCRGVTADHRDADRRVQIDVLLADRERELQALEHAIGNGLRLVLVVQALEQERELVAAEPGDGVAWSQALRQPLRRRQQDLVADEMAERVVDDLEAVEVEEEDGARRRRARAAADGVLEAVLEEHPVRQPGERVVQRVVLELQLGRLAVRDVGLGAREAAGTPVGAAHGLGAREHPAPAAVERPHAVLGLEVLGLADEVVLHGLLDLRPVLRVHPPEPVVCDLRRAGCRGRRASPGSGARGRCCPS